MHMFPGQDQPNIHCTAQQCWPAKYTVYYSCSSNYPVIDVATIIYYMVPTSVEIPNIILVNLYAFFILTYYMGKFHKRRLYT